MAPTEERISILQWLIQILLIEGIYMPIKGGKFNLPIIRTKINDSFFGTHRSGPIHTNPFSNGSGAKLRPYLSFSYRFRPSKLQRRSREKPHGRVSPPFWILTVEWSGAWSCLFWWRHLFQIVSFSTSTLENSVIRKHRFQIAPLWRTFSNGSVFGDRFRRCFSSLDDSRIRSKTAPFSFENL